VPPLAALFGDAAWELLRDGRPPLGAELAHEALERPVLLRGPRPFDDLWVEDLLPPVKALDLATVRQSL